MVVGSTCCAPSIGHTTEFVSGALENSLSKGMGSSPDHVSVPSTSNTAMTAMIEPKMTVWRCCVRLRYSARALKLTRPI